MNRPPIHNLEIIDIADKGRCVGRQGDVVVFTEGAVPGDVVDAETIKQYHSYIEAKITGFRSYSPDRTDPICEHFGTCGGCKWQNLNYTAQLRFKEKQVHDAMQRIAGLTDVPYLPIIGSETTAWYRNKLDFSFTNKRFLLKSEIGATEEKDMDGLGFHVPGKFNKVLDIKKCWLQPDRSNDIRNFIRDFASRNSIPFFDIRKQIGMMRGLIIRNTTLNEWMVLVMFRENQPKVIEQVMSAIRDRFPDITALLYVINTKKNDTISDQQIHVYAGREYITEALDGLQFRIGPKSFFQTNSRQTGVLYSLTREFAGLTGTENVYDLYTGTGTIAAFVSAGARKVVGVEYVPEAIVDAEKNAALNGLNNLSFFAGDLKDVLQPEFIRTHGKADVVITDPPRAGMHESVTARLLEMEPQRIVYVSCNPGTQARDIKLLTEKYRVVKMQPLDMFPHTSHVENIALLELK